MCRSVHCSIVGMLHIWKMFIPQLRMFSTIASQQVYHSVVDNLYLFVSLWMKCRASFQLGVHHLPQDGPKLSKKSRVPIWHDRCGQPKMDPNMLKENIINLLYSDLLFTRHSNTHLTKTVNDNIQIVMTFSRQRQTSYKIHWHTFLWMTRNRECCVEPEFSIRGIWSKTHHTSLYIESHNVLHMRPKTKSLYMTQSFFNTKMTRHKGGVGLPDYMYPFPCGYAQFAKVIQQLPLQVIVVHLWTMG